MKLHRQGDCVLRPVKTPELGIHITVGKKTQVMGETGQPHIVFASEIIKNMKNQEYAVVREGDVGTVEHPVHEKQTLESGVYSVGRVRSYKPESAPLNRNRHWKRLGILLAR